MQSPFPGMNPYLETPGLWPDVHNRLISTIADQLQAHLNSRYIAAVTPYVTFENIDIATNRTFVPDVALLEREDTGGGIAVEPVAETAPLTMVAPMLTRYHRIEIRTVGDDSLVTVIELLSPANKRPGADGADTYEQKRQEIMQTATHLLEIDLLRGGRRPRFTQPLPPYPYFLLLSRSERRPFFDAWPLSLDKAIPRIPVPLRQPDPDVPLDLGAALQQIYDRARYDLRIDYRQDPPAPELSADEHVWLVGRLRTAGLRD
jgi:hypothetical protein